MLCILFWGELNGPAPWFLDTCDETLVLLALHSPNLTKRAFTLGMITCDFGWASEASVVDIADVTVQGLCFKALILPLFLIVPSLGQFSMTGIADLLWQPSPVFSTLCLGFVVVFKYSQFLDPLECGLSDVAQILRFSKAEATMT